MESHWVIICKKVDKIRLTSKNLTKACLAEFCGTCIMIIFGCGVIAQVFLGDHGSKKHGDMASICWNWGFAVMMGVFFAGGNGSGHINPAITLAFAVIGRVPWIRVPLYSISQLLGAFVGACVVLLVNWPNIENYTKTNDSGIYTVTTTGSIFVTNPAASNLHCFMDQIVGTALLTAGALAIVEKRAWEMPRCLHPPMFGFLVCALVQAYALNAGCALNPARDLGPRLVLLCCGWGGSAFTSGNYYFWVPIVGPYVGAVLGALLYELTIGIHVTGRRTTTEEGEALE
ncbi:Aquaporin [Fasciola gigantica]|uniref:Aquaporin n=1 Tax=Fasciola gigantica TaxID=46835 RepID=A0A504Y973_FASGI|nr:Aquaporin [Fasciola gigantica]